jgi:hypothetical protein
VLTYSIETRTFKDFFGIDEYFWKLSYGFSDYFLGVIMGIVYFEFSTSSITYSRIPSFSSQESLEESEIMNGKGNIKEKITFFFSKKSFLYLLFSVLTILVIVLLDIFTLFTKLNTKDIIQEIPLFLKIYTPIESNIILIVLYVIMFRFIIVKKTAIRDYLERRYWIWFSRSFYITMFIAWPLSFLIVLNSLQAIKITFFKIVFLYISVLFIISVIGTVIMLVMEVPLKVAFKIILNKRL